MTTGFKKWTDEDHEFLRQNIDKGSYAEVGAMMGRTRDAIIARAKMLGLIHDSRIVRMTEKQVNELRDAALGGMSIGRLCAEFHRDYRTVKAVLEPLGIFFSRKSYHVVAQRREPLKIELICAPDVEPEIPVPEPMWRAPSRNEIDSLPPPAITRVKSCQFPMWKHGIRTPKEQRFCDAALYRGSYCEEHHKICWTPLSVLLAA